MRIIRAERADRMPSRRRRTGRAFDGSSPTSKNGSLLYFRLPPNLGTKLQRLAAKAPALLYVVEMLVDLMLARVEKF